MAEVPADPRRERGMRAQSEFLRTRLADGARQVGWKAGFGSPQGLAALGLTAPLVGFLLDTGARSSGATIDTSRWTKPVIEAEVAAVLAVDVPGDVAPSGVGAYVAGLVPALEVADVDLPPEDPEAILAGDIFQRAFVVGEQPGSGPVSGGLDCTGWVGRVTVGDEPEVEVVDLAALTGRFEDVLAQVARDAAAYGRGLLAGDVVLLGSIVPPVPVRPGDAVRYRLADHPELALAFA
ncbi:MAG: fumarylacetoacetate hydrolase family protein [Candidatus Nanopelagicales bacterium]